MGTFHCHSGCLAEAGQSLAKASISRLILSFSFLACRYSHTLEVGDFQAQVSEASPDTHTTCVQNQFMIDVRPRRGVGK